MSRPVRLQDAPPEVVRAADRLAESIADGVVTALADQYSAFDLDKPRWRDFVIGTLEWAVIKAADTAKGDGDEPANT